MNQTIQHGIALQAQIQEQVLRHLSETQTAPFVVVQWDGRVEQVYTTCPSRTDALVNAAVMNGLNKQDEVRRPGYRVWNLELCCFE